MTPNQFINHGAIDSLIFDMDGTLWDAVDSYAVIWNVTLDQLGIEHQIVTREDLLRLMGSYLDDILQKLIPNVDQRAKVLELTMLNEASMMPTLGGNLYPDVRQTLNSLKQNYKLFMVSNCGPQGLENFVAYNALEGCFTDLLSHGGTGKSKAENIAYLIDKYQLKSPVYVGDTQGDADQAHAAGIPFIWASYGFGQVDNPDAKLLSFTQIKEAISSINKNLIS